MRNILESWNGKNGRYLWSGFIGAQGYLSSPYLRFCYATSSGSYWVKRRPKFREKRYDPSSEQKKSFDWERQGAER